MNFPFTSADVPNLGFSKANIEAPTKVLPSSPLIVPDTEHSVEVWACEKLGVINAKKPHNRAIDKEFICDAIGLNSSLNLRF